MYLSIKYTNPPLCTELCTPYGVLRFVYDGGGSVLGHHMATQTFSRLKLICAEFIIMAIQ